jgi:glutamine amidotransferase
MRIHADAQADGFGIGWYSPDSDPKPAIPGTITSPQSQPATPGIPGTPGEGADHDKDESLPNGGQGEEGELPEAEVVQALELLKMRQHEAELENERPCVFKSISPVSATKEAGVLRELMPGVEQRKFDSFGREDPKSSHLVGLRCASR